MSAQVPGRVRSSNPGIGLFGDRVFSYRFLPTALNVNVKKFKRARVNGRSNDDSLEADGRFVHALQYFVPLFFAVLGRKLSRQLGITYYNQHLGE